MSHLNDQRESYSVVSAEKEPHLWFILGLYPVLAIAAAFVSFFTFDQTVGITIAVGIATWGGCVVLEGLFELTCMHCPGCGKWLFRSRSEEQNVQFCCDACRTWWDKGVIVTDDC